MSFIPAQSIQEVVQRLDVIIQQCLQQNSRLGYFAILYREVTMGVSIAIEQDYFDDGIRMEKLDVVFANRYLEAYHLYNNGQSTTKSWEQTFLCQERSDLIVVQHLLLGMNAHINLDLGIAAAAVATPDTIEDLHDDFDRINIVIANIYAMLMPRLKKVSWPIVMLSNINPTISSQVLNFSISKAREQAWKNALILCSADVNISPMVINTTDVIIAVVADKIIHPGWNLAAIIKTVRTFESNDVAKNMNYFLGNN